jgi:hypothetical protein
MKSDLNLDHWIWKGHVELYHHSVDSQIGRGRGMRCENSRISKSETIISIDRKEGRGLLILAWFEIVIQSLRI